jgi:7-cyano-7-deazaguanine tRNA-ribosyltransferase
MTELPSGDDLFRHNLWTILATMEEINRRLDAGTLAAYLAEVLDVHGAWFPGSALATSWRTVEDGRDQPASS